MLRELRIKNLAVIEAVTVPFAPGLNILTGETGAGKSILLDALLLLFGARAHPDLIRSDADGATVEAVFDAAPDGSVPALLEEAGLGAEDGLLIVRRELARSSRSRAFVNDSPVTLGLLERLGDHLVEIHGQHAHQRLMEPARQLELLDRFAEADELRGRVDALVREWQEARAALAQLRVSERDRAQQEDLFRFQLSEIEAARIKPGEEEALKSERRRLQHAERLAEGLNRVMAHLYDDPQSATTGLARAAQLLGELARIDPELAAPLPMLETSQLHLDEALAQLRPLRDRVVFDPERLEEIDARLDVLAKLKRKYGDSGEAILAYRDRIRADLERLEHHEEVLATGEAGLAKLAEVAGQEALGLSELRRDAAARLERLIQRELRAVGMEKARFAIVLRREAAAPDQLTAGPEGWRVAARGVDHAEFQLSPNPGEELKPLARVASGGELSRTMLGLTVILAEADRIPVMIFDEVDAGIGGRVADQVGQKLALVARHRQVLCVTHLSQIAAYASHHLRVEKLVRGGRTRTRVEVLDEAARVEELARMLGGEQVTTTARRHARELFAAARSAVSR
ncbi:MAG: DNA repair protein RecN [Candidatus Rokubacteria bacterium]|nr:DNA repair protein RecN [Candidatus Rokubacteria bacterium]